MQPNTVASRAPASPGPAPGVTPQSQRTEATAANQPKEASAFSPWLTTFGHISLEPARDGLIVLLGELSSGYTVAPAWLMDQATLREVPELLADLPSTTTGQSPGTLGNRVLRGKVSLDGSWPDHATAVLDEFPTGGCAGCFAEYAWKNGHFVPMAQRPIDPVWHDVASLAPTPRRISWTNGVTLWERYDYETGDSTLFLDPKGQKRSQRQRSRCHEKGHGPLRLEGPLSALALSDGSLLSIGNDCVTKRPTAEVWNKGNLTSTLIPLPGEPGSIQSASVYDEPVHFFVRPSGDIVVAFTAAHPSGAAPYFAVLRGQTFYPVSPPVLGTTRQLLEDGNAALYLLGYSEHYHLFRLTSDDTWQNVTPEGLVEGEVEPKLILSSQGRPWLLSQDEVHEWTDRGFLAHALPVLSTPEGARSCTVRSLAFLPDHEPVLVARCGGHSALLRRKPAEQLLVR